MSQIPRWVKGLLGLSLALNLLVAGLAIGAALRFSGADGAHRAPPSLGAAMYRTLPREDRKAFRAAMKDRPRERGDSRTSEAREITAALRALPLDVGKLEGLMTSHRQHRLDWQTAVHEAWIERVLAMTVSERADYAARLDKALSDARKSRGERGD
jgi:uncharacterized membrane protein